MKKFIAILLAVLTVLSVASVVAFAGDTTTTTEKEVYPCTVSGCGAKFDTAAALADHRKNVHPAASKDYVCDFCGKGFATMNELKAHIDETYAVASHVQYCDNYGEGKCTESFHSKAAYEAHMKICKYNDTRTDAQKLKDAIAAKDYKEALSLIVKIVVNFVKSDEFKKITSKVAELVGKINFDKLFATAKDLLQKLPLDQIKNIVPVK